MVSRRRRARRQGCWIERTSGGFLRLRFRWRLTAETGLHKFSETTDLPDTPENRFLLAKRASVIGAEIGAGTFDYLRWFPNGSKAAYFKRPGVVISSSAQTLTAGEYYEAWIARKLPPVVRPSRARDYRNHFRTYILDYLGEVPLRELTLDHLEDLRTRLRTERRLSMKTVRNVIDGSLRAMMRDASKSGFEVAFPFADLEWPRRVVPGPDPFTEDERDRLLEYFRTKRWRLGRHRGTYRADRYYAYYAFLFTLFYTGLRPSEAVALRVKSVELATGTLFIERSRSLGAEGAPKTAAAARVVRLTPSHVEILRQIVEIKAAEPDDYLFKNTLGDPIDQRSFYKLFCTAQRSLGLKHRDLYATKDTYVSIALTRGVNLTWLSEQTGVAEGTLRTHYGRFIHASKSDALELSKIDSKGAGSERFAPRLPLSGDLEREIGRNFRGKMVDDGV